MKQYVAAAALLFGGLLTTTATQAQTATPFTGGDKPKREAATKKRKQPSAEELARMQQRMSMNPDEVKRDQQIEVLEARAGISNSSLTRGSSSARTYDRASGGFVVREFRDKRNANMQKRGQTRPAPGIDPPGKPLKHKKPHKGFLFFK
ncbi:hypothetical protein EJV47_12110 [Hymenobacter gummosus]|uniref:DUF4890 domain-containing protein n=1 Tax=Hymenobacter gummosus TaxID=1776032 RepID=A0A3S0HN18_9BACT|nr:hypothetical protein [Hymenobacter gummosus]RTQ49562.1 hypothetical protein EJV47_12110 [Hymenobacter gummosus]